MKPPDFLKVLPADIGRVRYDGAVVLALIRYVTGLPGETNGRTTVDGVMWWRATHEDIGEALGGVHSDSVRRTLLKLSDKGELLARPAVAFYGDRAQAYRVPDVPLRESAEWPDVPLRESAEWPDVPLRESAECIPRKRGSSSRESAESDPAKVRNLPITGELEDLSEGEKGAALAEREPLDVDTVPDPGNGPPPGNQLETQTDPADAWVDAELVNEHQDHDPELKCARHPDGDTGTPCHGCRRVNEARKARQQQQDAAAMAAVFNGTTAATIGQATIADCPDCDEHGWRLDHGGRDGDLPKKCDHRGVTP